MNADDSRLELIRRQFDGEATADDLRQLEMALRDDAGFRVDFLRYVNLDVALGTAAQAAMLTESGIGRIATFPRAPAAWSPPYWRWFAVAAACAALFVVAVLPRDRNAPREKPAIDATISSAQSAIARLSVDPPSLFPAWASPTASLLDEPRISP